MDNKFIYILYAVSARYLSDEEVQKKFQIYKLKYNKIDCLFDSFKSFETLYSKIPVDMAISADPIAYFDNEEEAIEAAENNFGGYNDGGVYNYSIVSKMLMGYAYPEMSAYASYKVFKFQDDKYIPLPPNDEFGIYIPKSLFPDI